MAERALRQSLESIWDLRLAGDCEAAYEAYLDCVAAEGAGAPLADAALERDVRLLKLSFLRHRRNFAELASAEQDLAAWLESRALRPCERVQLQLGLNELSRGRLSEALELFVSAHRKARAAIAAGRLAAGREEQLAFFNSLLCMEDLGMDLDARLGEFEAGFGPHREASWARSIRAQLQALRLRSGFRRSRFEELPALFEGALEGEQAEYYATWLARLPYAGLAGQRLSAQERFSSGLARRGFGYMSQYRLRTLTMLLVPEDCVESVRLGEKVERLYLWTWSWLQQPDFERLGKILKVRSDIELSRRQTLSEEEHQMLRCVDLWLALFSGKRLAEAEERALGFTHGGGAGCSHLQLEERVIRWLALERDVSAHAADLRASLKAEAHLRKLPFFGELIEGGHGGMLGESILSLRERGTGRGVLVELLNQRIRIEGREFGEASSQALVQLLAAFQWKDVEEKPELLRRVFGLGSYDSLIHDPKLANLLSRANRLLGGDAQFSVKAGKVFAQLDRKRVRFQGYNSHSRCFLELPGFRAELEQALRQGLEDDRSGEFASFERSWWKRSDLEASLRLSKASCARWLKEWAPLLDTQGSGRSIRYQGKAGFSSRLAELSVRRIGHA
ncbi:MAG: hypothetical protein NDJ90_10615 [Oligoflexia bacterium]|nr:hypothetical protein [Oligoflexia bacterium]